MIKIVCTGGRKKIAKKNLEDDQTDIPLRDINEITIDNDKN